MSRLRFLGLAVLAPALAAVLAQAGRSADPAHAGQTCIVYSLSDLGDDPDLAKWVAETIPEVIAPGTWSRQGESAQNQVLRYYPPKKIIVVYHTPAVQAQVEGFLKDLKKSVSEGREKTAAVDAPRVVPAEYREPAAARAADPAPEPGSSYPVPAPARPPKHLFHFIIRYEGDGIIDDNVVKMLKIQNGVKEEKEAGGDEKPQHDASPPAPSSADPCRPAMKAEVKEDDRTRQPQCLTPRR
jgi:hypothetical protein